MNKIEIWNEDCFDVFEKLEDNSIDLLCTDPPYAVTCNSWDCEIDLERFWKEVKRIVKPNGAIVLFGDGMFTCKVMSSNPKMWRYNLIWNKGHGTDFLNAKRKPMKSHEDIMVFYQKLPTYNPQYFYGKPYKNVKPKCTSSNYGKYAKKETESKDGRRYPLTVLNFSKGKVGLHPTQKPVDLIEWLIKTYSNEGDTILDCFSGSNTTAIAAINTGRNAITIEKDKKYFETGKDRINNLKTSTPPPANFAFM